MARTSVRQLLRSGVLTAHELTAGQGVVLLAIADRVDADNEAYPSQETIAAATGMSRLGVRKAIGALVEKGMLEVVEPGGPRRSARYRLTIGPYLRATG